MAPVPLCHGTFDSPVNDARGVVVNASTAGRVGLLLILMLLAGCEKHRLDEQVKELCAKDGGVKVYEVVPRPRSEFSEFGLIADFHPSRGEQALGPEYLFQREQVSLRVGDPQMTRTRYTIVRKSDNKMLGETIFYARSGGEIPSPITKELSSVRRMLRQMWARYSTVCSARTNHVEGRYHVHHATSCCGTCTCGLRQFACRRARSAVETRSKKTEEPCRTRKRSAFRSNGLLEADTTTPTPGPSPTNWARRRRSPRPTAFRPPSSRTRRPASATLRSVAPMTSRTRSPTPSTSVSSAPRSSRRSTTASHSKSRRGRPMER